MADVTLRVVVQDQQVTQLQQRINQLNQTQITLNINSDNLKTMNTRLLDADKRSKNLTQSQKELQSQLGFTNQAFEHGTEQVQQNTQAMGNNQKSAENYQKAQRQSAAAADEHNKSLDQQGILYDILGRSLGSFIARMTAYRAVYAGIRAITEGFTEALKTLKAVDDELVTVRKVTGFDAYQMQDVESAAYAVASRYGVNAADYVAGVAEFARAGYKELSGELAELAQKTQIVGDTTADVANQFLLSVDAAYKYEGSVEKLNAVLDGANELDNKYATSIEKIAQGMGIVAPVAAQMHVGIDELAASIGTITAVTQRSGSETARALRALFLNIVGDTKTEIDEGVTWTTGEIEGLRDVIKVYARDAYDAAKATGSIIDPMEAMKGLSKSLKDGLLSEQELMQMVSDIGGKLRTSQLLALINNWDMYESMLEDYRNAAGSADKEIENAMDSWTRKTNVLQNTWTEFVKTGLDSDFFKGALDFITGIVERLDSLPAVLTRILMLVTAFNLPGISTWLTGIVESFQNANFALTAASGILGGIAVVWSAVSFAIESYNQAQEKARLNTLDAIEAAQQDFDVMTDLKARYEEIIDSTAVEADKEKELAKYKELLVEQYGFEREAVEKVNLERQTGIDLLNKEAEGTLRRTLSENSSVFETAKRIMEAEQTIFASSNEVGRHREEYEELTSAFEALGFQIVEFGSDFERLTLTGYNLEETYNKLGAAIDILSKKQLSRQGLTEYEDALLSSLRENYAELGRELDAYGDIYYWQIKLQALYNLLLEGVADKVINSKDAFDGLKRTLYELYGADKQVWDAMNDLLNDMFPQLTSAVQEEDAAVQAETTNLWANQMALEADADSTKRLQAAKADAEAAVRELLPILFDEEGKLTDVGEAALTASSYLADLANAELTLQNEIAQANYANIRAQLAAVSTDALKAAYALIAAYDAAQVARNMGYSVGNLGYGPNDVPAGTYAAVNLINQLNALQAQMNSLSVQATTVGTYGTGARSSGSSGRSSGSSGSGRSSGSSSSSSSSSSTTDAQLVALRDRVTLERSVLALLQAQGASAEDQAAQMQVIMDAIMAQVQYMQSVGASQTDINNLLVDWYNYQNKITELLREDADLTDEIADNIPTAPYVFDNEAMERELTQEAYRRRMDLLRSQLDLANVNGSSTQERIAIMRQIMELLHQQAEYLRSIGADQADINALSTEWWRYHNQISSLLEDEADSAEREADALQRAFEAQDALNNALRQRNVHYYNAATGQWEWTANPSNVNSASQTLRDAIGNLSPASRDSFYAAYGLSIPQFAPGTKNYSNGTNNYGPTYNIGGIQISEQDAKSMTLYQLLQLSKSLGIYNKAV